MNIDLKHLKEYEALFEQVKAEDPETHYKNLPGLINTPQQAKIYRLDAISRRIDDMQERLAK